MKEKNLVLCAWSALIMTAVFSACASTGTPAAAVAGISLDTAIQTAAKDIEAKLDQGTKAALLNFNSTSDQFSEYVLDELSANLVNSGKLVIVDRANLNRIREEQGFQLSGEVSDESAQAVGKMLGAQAIVTGTLTNIGGSYRIAIRAINVESAAIAVQYREDIANDDRVKALLAGGKAPAPAPQQTAGGTAAASSVGGTAASGGSRPQPAPIVVEKTPAPAQAPALRNGTYTFYPRLRAMQGGVDKNAYLDRIVVRSGYLTIYLVNVPQAKGGRAQGEWAEIYTNNNDIILQDLDRPTRTWNVTANGGDDVTGGQYLTFQGVTATRFSLTRKGSPNYVFDEIILGQPD